MNVVFNVGSTSQCVSSLVVMLLPRVRTEFTTSCHTHRCAVVWCLWRFRTLLCEIHKFNHHNQSRQQQANTQARVGVLMVHHPARMGHHTGGSRSKPNTQQWAQESAEQVLRDLSVRRSLCVSMECADVPDVSNAERSGNLSNVVSHVEALRQCMFGFSTDNMVVDNKVLTARCRWWNILSFSRVSGQCRLRWELLRVSRRQSGQGDTDGRSFEWSHLWVRQWFWVGQQQELPSTMLGTWSRMPLSPRKLSSTSVMCSACRVSSVTAESRRVICRTTPGARPREHCAQWEQWGHRV